MRSLSISPQNVIASVDPPSVSASKLRKEDPKFLSQFGFPLGYDGYIPNNRLRDLRMKAANIDENSEELQKYVNRLLEFSNGEVSYSGTSSSETKVLRPVLDRLMTLIANGMQSKKEFLGSVSSKAGVSLPKRDQFVLATQTSEPGPCVVYDCCTESGFSDSFIVIGSEAKGCEHSLIEGFSQVLHCIGEGCISLRRAGLEESDCAVPGLLIAGDQIQFIGTYLLPPAYPCFMTLSRAYCLFSYSDLRKIGKWIIALQLYGIHTCAIINDLLNSQKHAQKPKFPSVSLRFDGLWMKLVRPDLSFYYNTARAMASQIFYTFELLYSDEDLRNYIAFPVGVAQYPTHGSPLARMLRENSYLGKLVDENIKEIEKNGFLIIYSELKGQSLQEFLSKENIIEHSVILTKIKSKLKVFVDLLNKVKVAHMDLRPSNIMVSIDEAGCVIDLKVFDWDDALLFGTRPPDEAIDTFSTDQRYPQFDTASDDGSKFVVGEWCNSHFLDLLLNYIEQKIKNQNNNMTFSKFCESFKLHLNISN